MFDVLVESSGNKAQNAKQSAYFGTSALVLGSLFLGVFVYSLYSYNLGAMSGDDLSLNELVAPVMAEDAPPPPPAPENKPQKQVQSDAPKNVDFRTQIVQNMNEAPKVPDTTSVTKSNIPARREGVATVISNRNTDAAGGSSGPERTSSGGGGSSAIVTKPTVAKEETDDAPAAPTPVKKPPATISGGVLNGKASRLVQPPYPPAAKAVRAGGAVNVQVLIDENGNVISASATSGHALLRAAATAAARASKFTPTKLSGQAVKVNGVIVYNFIAQ